MKQASQKHKYDAIRRRPPAEPDPETESRRGVSGAGGGRKGKSQEFNGDTISIQEDGKVLEMHDGDGCTTV